MSAHTCAFNSWVHIWFRYFTENTSIGWYIFASQVSDSFFSSRIGHLASEDEVDHDFEKFAVSKQCVLPE